MSEQAVETIINALNTLRSMHEYVLRNGKNPEIKERASKGVERVDGAISELEKVLSAVYGRPFVLRKCCAFQ